MIQDLLPGVSLSPFKGYRLFRQIARFPELLPQMRSMFVDVLVERGIITREGLPAVVGKALAADGVPDTDAARLEYTDTIVDLLFASVLTPDEAENWVNLVRKRDRCQELGRVVAGEHSDSTAIWRALREFCDIPKGELYISREEHRRQLALHSNCQLRRPAGTRKRDMRL